MTMSYELARFGRRRILEFAQRIGIADLLKPRIVSRS